MIDHFHAKTRITLVVGELQMRAQNSHGQATAPKPDPLYINVMNSVDNDPNRGFCDIAEKQFNQNQNLRI